MQMKEKSIDFERCANALYTVDKNIGKKEIWPPAGAKDIYAYSSNLALDLYGILKKLDAYPDKVLADKIKSAASLWKLLSFSINGMRNAPDKWTKEKREFVVGKILSVISEKKETDLYCETGGDLLKGGLSLVKNALAEKPIPNSHNTVELKTSGWLYAESIYYMMHDLGAETHGPYALDGKKYLIHDFYNLKPRHIWPDARYFGDLNFESVRVVSEYRDISITFDAFNNYYTKTDISKPERGWVFIDGQPIDAEKLSETVNVLQKATVQAYKTTMELSKIERAKKNIELVWSVTKPWKELIKKEWKPKNTREMLTSKRVKMRYEKIGFLKKFNVSLDLQPTGTEELVNPFESWH